MPRTVIDCSDGLAEQDADVLLDSAIRAGMSRRVLVARMDALCGHGRSGSRLLRRLVADREAEQGLAGSVFERILLQGIRKAGLPTPALQWHFVEDGFRAHIDLAYPEYGIAIEAEGYRWHDGRRAYESDRKRVSELSSRGWRVILVTWLQLKYERDTVMNRLARALSTPPLMQLRA